MTSVDRRLQLAVATDSLDGVGFERSRQRDCALLLEAGHLDAAEHGASYIFPSFDRPYEGYEPSSRKQPKPRRRAWSLPTVLVSVVLAASLAGPIAQAREPVAEYASIPFADIQGIKNWQADGNTAMLIEAYNNRWYRATFFSPCVELPWHPAVAFVTEPAGALDRFGSIIAGGERCYFKTFEEVPSAESPVDGGRSSSF